MANEISEIDLSPCIVNFTIHNDGMVSTGLESSKPHPLTVYQVCISFNAELIDFVPMTGEGPIPIFPRPSLLAFLISDQRGMFGRSCPTCKSYFRTSMIDIRYATRCPYCAAVHRPIEFTTENQLRFFGAFFNHFHEVYEKKQNLKFDISELAENLSDNKPSWVYREELQERQFKCPNCKNIYDILGDYAGCPNCGRKNVREVLTEKIDSALKTNSIDTAKLLSAKRIQDLITPFEAMAKHLQIVLLKIQTTPRRRKEIEKINFQRLIEAAEKLDQFFGFKLFKNVKKSEQKFLGLMLQKRHAAIHNDSRVDEHYLEKSGDSTVKLNATIKTSVEELSRLSKILKIVASNFVDDFESIA